MNRTNLLRKILVNSIVASFVLLAFSGCHRDSHPDDKAALDNILTKNGLGSVVVNQDRSSGVITLSGIVGAANQKAQAETLAIQAAPGYTISNNIQIVSSGLQDLMKDTPSQEDKAIEDNFKAAIKNHKDLQAQNIQFSAGKGTLYLRGSVNTAAAKRKAEALAKKIPQVQHVVNEIQVAPGRHTPASS